MSDPSRDNPDNIIIAIAALTLIQAKINNIIENKKRDVQFLSQFLEENLIWHQEDEVALFVDNQLQKRLIEVGVLPDQHIESEEWSYDDVIAASEPVQAEDEEDEEEREENEDGNFGIRYLTELSHERQKTFLLASLDYFVQVLFDFGLSKLSYRNHVHYSAVNFLQQTSEKFMKLILLCTVRRRYFLNLNNHILHHLAQQLYCPRGKELEKQAQRLELLKPADQFFYSSLSVRTRYPPKTTILLFEAQDLPCHRFDKESSEIAFDACLKIIHLSSQLLAEVILDHFPSGKVYLPSINANVQLLGTDLYYPEDFIIEFL